MAVAAEHRDLYAGPGQRFGEAAAEDAVAAGDDGHAPAQAELDRGQAGTFGTRASFGSAQRSFGITGAHPGRSGSWSYG